MNTATLTMPAPTTMSLARRLRAYAMEARFELVRTARAPVFLFPMLVLPVMLYLFFGVVLVGQHGPPDPKIALLVFSGFAMFSVVGPGMFGFGIGLAIERQSGALTLKRALPMPAGSNLLAKLFAAMVLASVVVALLLPIATLYGHVTMNGAQIARFAVVAVLGVVPFCALGLLIGSFVSGTAAPGVVNLLYFPMIYLSGLFPFPLPKAMQTAAVIWPAFHLNQLGLAAVGLPTAIDPRIAATVLVVLTVVCIGLAMRRLERVG